MGGMRPVDEVRREMVQAVAVARDHDLADDVDVASYYLGVAAGLLWATGGPWPAPTRTIERLYTPI